MASLDWVPNFLSDEVGYYGSHYKALHYVINNNSKIWLLVTVTSSFLLIVRYHKGS